ncbi:MAG: methyl-accepting chemotaxis protein, partial [Sulfurospirillum sp.]
MKISTRILISLILSLIVLGACIIGVAYSNTKNNARMFIEEYEKSAYAFHENELKNIMDIMKQTAESIYKTQKAKGISDEKIQEAILDKFNDLRFF